MAKLCYNYLKIIGSISVGHKLVIFWTIDWKCGFGDFVSIIWNQNSNTQVPLRWHRKYALKILQHTFVISKDMKSIIILP